MAERSRIRLRRLPQRGSYERAAIAAILDAAPVSHLGTVDEAGFPVVIPTLHARVGDHVYVHGSAASATLRRATRADVCLTATLIDGLVLARSAFHHSVNYRSAMLFGAAELLEQPDDKRRALAALVDKLAPGRWADVRQPDERELRATSVLRIPLDEASAKVRSGGPVDDEPDYELPVWAGVVGLRLAVDPPQPDERLAPGIACPPYVAALAATAPAS